MIHRPTRSFLAVALAAIGGAPCFADPLALSVKEVAKDSPDHVVYVESPGHFRLGAVRGMNYGISEWYDLANDPEGKLNIPHRLNDDQADQGSLLNQVINPGDLIGHILIAKNMFKDAPRSCNILEQNAVRAILETEYHPMFGHGINPTLTFKTTYTIYATGRIGIVHKLQSETDQTIELWRNSTLSLGDPTYHFGSIIKGDGKFSGTTVTDASQHWKPDSLAGMQVNFPNWIVYEIVGNTETELKLGKQLAGGKPGSDGPYDINSQPGRYGWLRCSDRQSPYSWQNSVSEYLRIYWDPTSPEPYAHWTKASIMLAPRPDNPHQGGQNIHGWDRFKRMYYEEGKFDMKAKDLITQYYMVQLGTQGDALLPDFSTPDAAKPIADNYRHPSALEFTTGSADADPFDFGTAAYRITAANNKVAFKSTGANLKPAFEIAGLTGKGLPKISIDGNPASAVAARVSDKLVVIQLLTDLKPGAQVEVVGQ